MGNFLKSVNDFFSTIHYIFSVFYNIVLVRSYNLQTHPSTYIYITTIFKSYRKPLAIKLEIITLPCSSTSVHGSSPINEFTAHSWINISVSISEPLGKREARAKHYFFFG